MIRLLLGTGTAAAAFLGASFWYFHDSPVIHYHFPERAPVHGGMAVERLAMKAVNGGSYFTTFRLPDLEKMYDQAVLRKFNASAAAQTADGAPGVDKARYIELEKEALGILRLERHDLNNNGIVEKKEWAGDAYDFGWYDKDDDELLTAAELWSPHAYEKNRWFARADKNNDGLLDAGEYVAAHAGGGKKFAEELDDNQNGRLERGEMHNGNLFYGVYLR